MKPFIVLKSWATMIGHDERTLEYSCVTAERTPKGVRAELFDGKPFIAQSRSLTRDEAKRIIKQHGLVLSEKNTDGSVYDTPDRRFKKTYGGLIYIPETI